MHKTHSRLRARSPVDLLRDNAFARAVSHLPDVMRWVMLLGGRDGLSTDEIATLSGVKRSVIDAMLSRGRALIQNELRTCGPALS